jgi:hypothetical protein
MFEVLLAVAGSERFQAIIQPALPGLVALTLSFMVMTADQEAAWEDNPNQYVADMEEDFSSSRASAELLLHDLCEVRCRGGG